MDLVESSNTWMLMHNPSWWCPPEDASGELDWGCVTHAYEYNAFKADTQELFFRRFNDPNVYRYHVVDPPSSDWTQTADLPEGASSCCCTGLEFFPEMDRLVYVDCTAGDLLLMDLASDTWTPMGGSFVMGPYHNLSSYNPIHHLQARSIDGKGGKCMSLRRIIWSLIAGTSIFLSGCEREGEDPAADAAADQQGGDVGSGDNGDEEEWPVAVPMYGARGCSIGNVE